MKDNNLNNNQQLSILSLYPKDELFNKIYSNLPNDYINKARKINIWLFFIFALLAIISSIFFIYLTNYYYIAISVAFIALWFISSFIISKVSCNKTIKKFEINLKNNLEEFKNLNIKINQKELYKKRGPFLLELANQAYLLVKDKPL